MDEDIEYLPERGVFDRVTIHNEQIDVRTPEGAFIYSFFEAFDTLSAKLNLTDTKRNSMIQTAKSLPNIRHKNAAAFIYGYLIAENGRISRTALGNMLPKLDMGVTLADVLRYARLLLE